MPKDIMLPMRHASIETTQKYCVGRNAQTTTDILWEAYAGDNAGNDARSAVPR